MTVGGTRMIGPGSRRRIVSKASQDTAVSAAKSRRKFVSTARSVDFVAAAIAVDQLHPPQTGGFTCRV
jgi:hypothetical protein